MRILILILNLLLFTIPPILCDKKLETEISNLLKTIIDLAKANIHNNEQVKQYFKTDFTYIYGCNSERNMTENMHNFLSLNVRDQLQLSNVIMDYREETPEIQYRTGGGARFTKKYVINVKPLVGLGRIQLDIHRLEGGGDDGQLVLAAGRRVDCKVDFVSQPLSCYCLSE